jgi:hypothetical protein
MKAVSVVAAVSVEKEEDDDEEEEAEEDEDEVEAVVVVGVLASLWERLCDGSLGGASASTLSQSAWVLSMVSTSKR